MDNDQDGYIDPEKMDVVSAQLVSVATDIATMGAPLRIPIKPPASDSVTVEHCSTLTEQRREIAYRAEECADELLRLAEIVTVTTAHLQTVWRWTTTAIAAPHVELLTPSWRISPRRSRHFKDRENNHRAIQIVSTRELLSWTVHLCSGSAWVPPGAAPDPAPLAARLFEAATLVREGWSGGNPPALFIENMSEWLRSKLAKSLVAAADAEAAAAAGYGEAIGALLPVARLAGDAQAQAYGGASDGDWTDGFDCAPVVEELGKYRRCVPDLVELARCPALQDPPE